MTDPVLETADDGHVIVSFDVSSELPIEELKEYLREPKRPTGELRYLLGTTDFDEPSWERRASLLGSTINGFIDLLATIPRDVLHASTVFVRLYVTFPRGAETIDAQTVKRLAEVNATLWIDA